MSPGWTIQMQAGPQLVRRKDDELRRRIDERADQLSAQNRQSEGIVNRVANVEQELGRRITRMQDTLRLMEGSQDTLGNQVNQLPADLDRVRRELGAQVAGMEQGIRAELQEVREQLTGFIEEQQTDTKSEVLFDNFSGDPGARKCLEWLACRRPFRICHKHCIQDQV